MRHLVFVIAGLALSSSTGAAYAHQHSSKARVCIEREEQNGSLNTAPTVLSIRSQVTGKVYATRRLEDAGLLCARVPRGRYVLVVRLAQPWTRSPPLHWWTRTYPLDLRGGDASYVITNPQFNDEFQAMIAGRNGWHHLWPIHRTS
jgi:hypothetical protein